MNHMELRDEFRKFEKHCFQRYMDERNNYMSQAPFQSHSQTSRDGAKRASLRTKPIILHAVQFSGRTGITGKEIANAYGLQTGTVSARLRELQLDGFIKKSAERRNGGSVWKLSMFVPVEADTKTDKVKEAQALISKLRVNANLGELSVLNQISEVLK